MTTPFDFQVHRPVKGGAEHEMTEDPYVVIGSVEGDIYLRYGKFWTSGGNEVAMDDLSEARLTQVDGLTDEALASVGFGDWIRKDKPKAPLAPAPAPAPVPQVFTKAPPAPVHKVK